MIGTQASAAAVTTRHDVAWPVSSARRAALLGLLLTTAATPALAQTVPTPGSTNTPQVEQTTQQSPGSLPPAPQADDVANPQTGSTVIENAPQSPQDLQTSDNGLGEIVVTATKRETNLQKTPIAISVVNTQSLTDRHADSLLDLGDGSIPSLRIATFEARQSALTVGIRGIVPFDQNQTARDSGVGIYIDGIYLARSQGLNANLLDIERIEVLRGPQGTLFGRNTEGGALSIITKGPTGELGLRASAGVGNYGSYDGAMHLDLPSVANFAVKLDGIIHHQDATVKNPLSGQYGWNYQNVVGGRAAGRWTPTDRLTLDVSYDYTKDENTPNYSQLLDYNPLGKTVGTYIVNPALVNPNLTSAGTYILVAPGSTTKCSSSVCIAPLSPLVVVGSERQKIAEIGVPQQVSTDISHGVDGTIRFKVTPNLEFRSITGWRAVDVHQWDNSGGPHRTVFAPYANFSRYSLSELFQHQFSQELQMVGSLPSLDYVFGAYYFVEHVEEAAATPSSNQWNLDGTGYIINSETRPNPSAAISSSNQGWDRPDWYVQRHSTARARSYAAFGQATWTPAGFDLFHLTAGGRYTRDERTGVLDFVNGKVTNFLFTFENNRFDPMVVAAFDAAPTIHLYAKYSTGYRAGGANDRSATFRAFGPEAVKAYELGAKMDLFDHRARLNLAGYIMDRNGTQIDFDYVETNPTSPYFNLHTEETVNAPGVSKIRGLEADFTVRPVQNLTLGASYAYTHIDVPVTPNPLPGSTNGVLTRVFTVFTPEHAASGFIDYELPVSFAEAKLRFHVDATYASSQYSFQSENVKTDSSFIVNGRISLADITMNQGSSLLTLAAWSRNLLDETHVYRRSASNAGSLGDYGNFNPPRTFGFEAAVKVGAPRVMAAYVPLPPPPPPVATQTCPDGSVIEAMSTCPMAPPPPPPPPPPVVTNGERG
ncbi:MAG: TonB-dependent receptor [Sphingomicrobium sp.]